MKCEKGIFPPYFENVIFLFLQALFEILLSRNFLEFGINKYFKYNK